jgi:excinuclease ABC subunit C
VKERLKHLPQQPGVYIFKDVDGRVLYVGKAIALRNRLRSYFHNPERLHPKVRAMMNRVADFDYIITSSEVEALILENNLIKGYRPRYNIDLRDDKTYPYLKITLGEQFPRICITREKKDGSSRYFGPYTDVAALRETLKMLTSVFPLRTCRVFRQRSRPCLNHDIKKCLAPCSGKVSGEEYRALADGVIRFLEGDIKPLIKQMEAEMKEAAAELEFEKAARLRDGITGMMKIHEKQQINLEKAYDLDMAAVVQEDKFALVLLFKIRAGRIVDRYASWINPAMDENSGELIQYFLQHYYHEKQDIPAEIYLNVLPANPELLEQWLRTRTRRMVRLSIPRRGEKKRMLLLLEENARILYGERMAREQAGSEGLIALSRALQLEELPRRMECYDISHLAGEETTASMVVFTDGVPDKKAYRRFKIKQDQNDDFASLAEVLQRRFLEARKGNTAFQPGPDLILIDGGLGQVNAVARVLQELQADIPLFGLAKKQEEIYRPGDPVSLRLPPTDQGLKLLQRLRDEAHRFAIEYNRSRRQKKLRISALDNIPGVGPRRKQALLSHFGSARRVKEANLEDLQQVPGISSAVARNIYQHLRENKTIPETGE